jgi:hypothetical protein
VFVIVFHGWSAAVGLTEFHGEDNHLSRDRRMVAAALRPFDEVRARRREIGGMMENALPPLSATMDVAVAFMATRLQSEHWNFMEGVAVMAAQANSRHQPVACNFRDLLKRPSQDRAWILRRRRVGVHQGLCGAVRRPGVQAAQREHQGQAGHPQALDRNCQGQNRRVRSASAQGTAEDRGRKREGNGGFEIALSLIEQGCNMFADRPGYKRASQTCGACGVGGTPTFGVRRDGRADVNGARNMALFAAALSNALPRRVGKSKPGSCARVNSRPRNSIPDMRGSLRGRGRSPSLQGPPGRGACLRRQPIPKATI